MKSKLKYTLIFFIVLAGCNLDQATKHIARESLKDSPPLILFRGFVDFCYAENRGMAFSLLSNLNPPLRKVLAIFVPLLITVCFSCFILRYRAKHFTSLLPFALILSGAAGNLLDRIRYGYVIDFVHFHVHDILHWPIFNMADVLVFMGGLLLVLQYSLNPNKYIREEAKGVMTRLLALIQLAVD